MSKNMGRIDRTLRITLALAVGILVATGSLAGAAAVVLSVFAAVFVVTGFVGFCPLYTVLGLSTCGKRACPETGR